MSTITFEQAVRNAVEVEREAERFYRLLSESTADDAAKKFLDEMAAEEHSHALRIDRFGKEMAEASIPKIADDNVGMVETAPEWRFMDDLSLQEAIQVALENEQHAQLYYCALAEIDAPYFKEFFSALAADEEAHAERLESLMHRRNTIPYA